MYLSGVWDEVHRNEIHFVEFLAVHPEVFRIPDISTPASASSCPVKVFEEDTTYVRYVTSCFALDANDLRSLFYIVCQVITEIISKRLKHLQTSGNQFV